MRNRASWADRRWRSWKRGVYSRLTLSKSIPTLTQGNAGNANTGTLTLKDDNRIENPSGATEDDRIKTAIDAAVQSASATTTPPGTTYNYPNTSRFKIGKFSDIAGLTIPSGYTSDDWVIGFEDLTDNDFNDGFWAVKVEVDDGYDDDESESEDDVSNCCNDCGCAVIEDDSGGTNGESKDTDCPISYHDGTVNISETDFAGNGFGVNWSTTRNWSNELTLEGDKAIGNGWMLGSRPFLQQSGDDIKFVTNGRDAKWFEGSGGSYTPRFHTTGSFVTSGSDFIYRDSSGQTFTFWGFGSAQPGQLKEMTTRGGVTTSLTYTSGQLTEVNRSQVVGSDTIYERYVYTYLTSGDNTGKISNIDQQRKINAGSWSTVREADYTYYNIKNGAGTADDPGGNVGDLKRVVVKDGSGNTITTSYYRYWEHVIDGSGKFTQPANGYVGGLKYVVTDASYNRLVEAVGASNVDSTSDTTLATYANHYFEYNKDREATKEIAQGEGCSTCTGGLGSFTYSRTKSAHAKSFNNWVVKTIETLPDGNQNIVYTNGYGKIMLKAYKETATGNQWIEYWRYDANGRVIRRAAPSAVTGYDDANYADLVNYNTGSNTAQYLSDSSGLIEIFEYGTSTTATSSVAGDVTGYLKSTSLQNGDTGTAVLQVSRTYIARTGGSNTIYPVASETIYRNTGGGGGQTTNYTYTWIGSTTQMATRTVSLPAATTAQNGSNAVVTAVTHFDTYGRAIWVVDGDGYITYNEYDQNTGAMTKQVVDANPGSISGAPVSGPTRSGSLPTALGLTTTMVVDNLGRVTKVTDPNGNVTIGTAGTDYLRTELGYDDRGRQARVKRADGTWTHTVYDGLGRVVSTWKGTDNTGWTQTNPAGSGGSNNMVKVSENIYDNGGIGDSNVTESRSVFGSGGSDFYATKYQYDFRNRMTDMRSADKVGTKYTLDNLGQLTTIEYYADADTDFVIDSTELRGKTISSFDERGQVFDSTVYEVDPSTGSNPGTIRDGMKTLFWYDARGNVAKTRDANGLQNKNVYDGAGRLSKTYMTIDADETAYSEINSVSDDRVIEQNNVIYDLGGRVVHTLSMKRKNDSPSTGAFHSENSWSQAIINWYDAADRIIATANYGSELRGDYLNSGASVSPTPTRNIYNRTSGTMIDSDSDGIPNIAEGSVPITPVWSTNEQDHVYIIAKFSYDSAGRLYRVADNKRRVNGTDQGRINETQFDLAGRKTKLIENYVDGVANSNDFDFDRVTDYTYHTTGPIGQPKEIIAYNVRGSSYGLAVAQTTKFFYDSTIDKSWVTDTVYPDSDDTSTATGADGVYDRIETDFDRLGRKTTEKDQRGVVHTYTYDSAGRFSTDSIGTGSLPTGVEGTVRTIEYGYDDQSRANLVSSKNSAGTIINQVKTTFDGWGNVIKSEQDHAGAVSGSTPSVQYAYADGASGGAAKYVRLDTITYPNGRVIKYNYNTTGSDDDVLSRVDTIRDNTASKDLVEYNWIGAYDMAGEEKHPSISGGLTLTWGFGGNLMLGWDRFERILKHQWRSSGGTTVELDRFDYKYDTAGNRVLTDREVTVSGVTVDDNHSESFEYDGLDRLVDYRRGKLSGGIVPKSPTDSTNLLYRQYWATLDGSGNVTSSKLASHGNWMEWTVDTNGGTAGGSTTQVRNVNSVNEIDDDNVDTNANNAITGNSWIDPLYDKSGNMTTAPKGQGSETSAVYFVYDGWGRVAGISSTQVPDTDFTDTGEVQYEYDGTGRRIQKIFAGTSVADEDTYYAEGFQAIETRRNGSSNAYEQQVWNLRYIDAPVVRYRDANGHTTSTATGDGTLEETLYVTYDGNFNVTGLVQENQTFVERYVYTPYGDRKVLDANFTDDSDNLTDYDFQLGHQGLRIDSESGTYYNRARQLHSGLGSFTRRDPLLTEYPDGPNLYQAYQGNPVIRMDPFGEQSATTQPAENDCCCCCVDRLDVKTVRYMNRLDARYGHDIDIDVFTSYKQVPNATDKSDCTLEWWERTNLPAWGNNKQQVNTWQDGATLFPDSPVFKGWQERKKPKDGQERTLIADLPNLTARRDNPNRSRTLEIWVVVRSGEGCDCKNREATVWFLQNITLQGNRATTLKLQREGPFYA
ncbi:MAG: hypothetical protein KatS3mg104_1533 [Phycisphaerae bacterium]|nr:MAG: hypothetical protein KatS3mg104_1533 [Phycisphaerae bacterium]